MKLPEFMEEAVFVQRLNRFAALLELSNNNVVMAHVPNSGRLHELLIPGTRMFLTPAIKDGRKTGYDLSLVQINCFLVSADARLPGRLLREAIQDGLITHLQGYESVRMEVAYGDSRLDMLLRGPKGLCYVETKSVTLVAEGIALFPDAPTDRGKRHVEALAKAVSEGYRGIVVFVVQREDAVSFSPHYKADPKFGMALKKACGEGIEAYAYKCHVSREEINITSEIPVVL